MRFVTQRILVVLTLAVLASAASASDFDGDFRLATPETDVRLTLRSDSQGAITGKLSGATGAEFELQGETEDDRIGGICISDEGTLMFEAAWEGEVLLFTLVEMDEYFVPDYDSARTLSFTRTSNGHPAFTRTPPRPAAPRHRPGNVSAEPSAGLVGVWKSVDPGQPATLSFSAGGVVDFDGSETIYQQLPDAIRVETEQGPLDFPYTLAGDRLSVRFPDGSLLNLQRSAEAPPSRGSAAGGAGDLRQILTSSKWCCYTFSSGGGYSGSGYDNYRFLADGRLLTGSGGESSWSGEAGWGFAGNRDHGGGRWELRDGRLFIDTGGGGMEPVSLEIKREGDNVFLMIDDSEYMRCDD